MAKCPHDQTSDPSRIPGMLVMDNSKTDQFTSCQGTQTLCTIASSVSNLVVSESKFSNIEMTTADQDSCCCPPKRIRMAEHDGEDAGEDSWLQSSMSVPSRHGCSRRDRKQVGEGDSNVLWCSSENPSAGSDTAGSLTHDVDAVQYEPVPLKLAVGEGDGCAKLLWNSENKVAIGLHEEPDERSVQESSQTENRYSPGRLDVFHESNRMKTTLALSPCFHVFDSRLSTEEKSQQGKNGNASNTKAQHTQVSGCTEHSLTHVCTEVGENQLLGGSVEKSPCPTTQVLPFADSNRSGGRPGAEESIEESTGTAHPNENTDKVGGSSGASASQTRPFKQGHSQDFQITLSAVSQLSEDGGDGALSPGALSSTDTPSTPSPTRMSAPSLSTDYETDSSGCSESSTESSVSSSDNCPDQSASRVNSARVFHQRAHCSTAVCREKGRSSKGWPLKKRTPKYGLKTDAVDAVIGLRRSNYTRIKQQSCSSQTSGDRRKGSHVVRDTCTFPFSWKNELTIDDLPCVLLVHIFSFLPVATRVGRVGLVCRKWQSAVLDPALWRRLDLRNLPRLKDDILLQLASLSDRVSTLILSDGRSTLLTDQGVSTVLHQCHYLTKVKFNRCFFLSDEAFQCVGQCCQGLVCLNLSGCFTVTDKTLLAISEGCRQLQDLDLGQCAKITDEGVCAVAKNCPLLTSFRLDQCSKLTNRAVETMAVCCPDLQFLHLLSCALTDSGISHLAQLKKLRVLDISNMSQLSPRVVERVVTCCSGLETLAISLNRAVDDQCLRHIVTHCPKLRCLSCVACGLSNVGMHYIAQYAKNLERLDVAWCADITDAGIIEISDACPKLRYLGIMRCGLITMTTVEQLLQRHPTIQYSNFELDSRRLLGRAAAQGLATL